MKLAWLVKYDKEDSYEIVFENPWDRYRYCIPIVYAIIEESDGI